MNVVTSLACQGRQNGLLSGGSGKSTSNSSTSQGEDWLGNMHVFFAGPSWEHDFPCMNVETITNSSKSQSTKLEET